MPCSRPGCVAGVVDGTTRCAVHGHRLQAPCKRCRGSGTAHYSSGTNICDRCGGTGVSDQKTRTRTTPADPDPVDERELLRRMA